MNDIQKSLDTLSKLDEGPLGTALYRGLARRQPKPTQVTEIPPFDPESPVAQAAAARRQSRQQQVIDKIDGRDTAPSTASTPAVPASSGQPSVILGPDGKPMTSPAPQVWKQPQRGPGYKSPYDEELPSGLDNLPAADSDIMKGIEAAKSAAVKPDSTPTKLKGDYSPLAKAGRWAERKLKKHAPDINTAAAGAAAYNTIDRWDEIKQDWDKKDLTNKLGIGTAEEFLAGQIKNLNDYLFKQNEPTTVKEDIGSDPHDWKFDNESKMWRYTRDRDPPLGRQLSRDVFDQEIYKPYLQAIEPHVDYKKLKKSVEKHHATGQGKSIVGTALGFLNPKKHPWVFPTTAAAASTAELFLPEPFKPSAMVKLGQAEWEREQERRRADAAKQQSTGAASAPPTSAPSTSAPPAATSQPTSTPGTTDTKGPVNEPQSWRERRRRGADESLSYASKKYLKEYKRYIDSV